MPAVFKSGSLNLLEPSGPVQITDSFIFYLILLITLVNKDFVP